MNRSRFSHRLSTIRHDRMKVGCRARLAVVIFVLAATGGCSGGEETNGLERKRAVEVEQAAGTALRDARTVHVTGLHLGLDPAVVVDLRVQDEISNVTAMVAGSAFEIIKAGEDVYLKGDQAAWQALRGPSPVDGFASHWVKLRSGQVTLDAVSLVYLSSLVTDNERRMEAPVEQTTLDGKKAVMLTRLDGSRLYVANTGRAYPLRIENTSNGSQIEFTEHGVDFRIAVPNDALNNAATAGELAWLDAVEKLFDSMNNVFGKEPKLLTPKVLASLADQLRGCSRELARIGPPTNRLLPVHTLVAQACARYDQGAQCFTTAASIGIPIAGSAAAKKFDESIDCGFSSSEAIVTLHDAINKGHEIKF
jgi:hypothetical protein